MSFTVTQRASDSNGTSSSNVLGVSSHTPADNSLELVWFYIERDNHAVASSWQLPANSGAALTWTVEATTPDNTWAGDNNYGGAGRLWSAPVVSHAAMTISLDAYTGTNHAYLSAVAFDIIADAAFALAQPMVTSGASEGGGDSESLASGTLASAATTGNLCILVVGASNDGAGAFTAPGGVWTQLTNQSQNSTHVAVFYSTTFTGTSVTITDLGQIVGHSGSVLMEFDESGGAPAALPQKPIIVGQGAAVQRATAW